MVVPGAGGTGMCFVSNPKDAAGDHGLGSRQTQIDEIGASLLAAMRDLPDLAGDRVRIAQMLFEPKQDWTHEVSQNAGMISVGTLDYMRLSYDLIQSWTLSQEEWPDGITVRPLRSLEADHDLLSEALEASYEGHPRLSGTVRDAFDERCHREP